MSANTRYDDTAALARVAKRHAPEGADMQDQSGECEIERAIRMLQSPAWIKELDAREAESEATADALFAAKAEGVQEGAQRERRGSQKVMIGMAALLTISVALNFAQWVLR